MIAFLEAKKAQTEKALGEAKKAQTEKTNRQNMPIKE